MSLRILLVAEHASKRFGGEAILPYHYFRVLRDRHLDAYLIVHERTRTELEALFPNDLDRLCFVKDMQLQKLFYHLGKLLPRRIAEATLGLANQLLTQYAQRAIVRSLATPRTVVHQPIPVSPRFPSLLAISGIPLVVGPMNGGMDYPPSFRQAESSISRAVIAFGRSLSNLGNALLPGKRKAAIVLVANKRTQAALPSGIQGRVIELVENGVDLQQWQAPAAPFTSQRPFLFLGRLVDWKALDIVLEAMPQVPEATLQVIGDGAMRTRWLALARTLGLADRVQFLGWRSQQECAALMANARALVLPSIYECGGAVVLEAMAMSKPVIATNWGGPADYLNPTCGILIEPSSREAMVDHFAQAMTLLLSSPDLSDQMGSAGRARLVAHFDWEKKVDRILELYVSVLPPEVANT